VSVEVSFWLLGLFAFATAVYGMFCYRTPVNPLTVFSVVQIGLFTLLSGIIASHITGSLTYTDADVVETVLVSVVYLGAVLLPYFFRGSLPSNLFGKGLGLLGLRSETIATRFSAMKLVLLLTGAGGAYAALALVGGGGMLWLTNTREAYLVYRAGAGPFFALTQWLLTFAFLYYLWSHRPQWLRLLLIMFFFAIPMYFLGSKSNLLTVFVIGLVYYNFRIKRIPFPAFFVIVPLIFLAVIGLLLTQDSYGSLLAAPLYFKDYFDTSARFLSRFDEFGFYYGKGWLSSLWFYVPRGLYPDKPYEYGVTLIHQVLFPGAAAGGHTPGLLPWSLSYLDFGVAGVLVRGVLVGILQRMAYEDYLKHREEFFSFIFMMQFSVWPIWIFAPLVVLLALSLAQSIFLRLVWRRRIYPTPETVALL